MITDKVTFEYEIEVPGRLLHRYCPDSSVLPVATWSPMRGMRMSGRRRGSGRYKERPAHRAAGVEPRSWTWTCSATHPDTPRPQRQQLDKRVRATPAARRIARENDVTIEASPPGHSIEVSTQAR